MSPPQWYLLSGRDVRGHTVVTGSSVTFNTEPTSIGDHLVRRWQIGTLSLWVRRGENGEWFVAQKQETGADEDLVEADVLDEEPADLTWQRYALPELDPTLTLTPHLPDRPLVVRSETPLSLVTGGSGVFYALLPCWIRLTVGGTVKLAEVPSVRLSGSWFGDPISGELCYAMRTNARRSIAELPSRPHRAVCTLRLNNQDSNHLEVKRICVHAGPLAVYRGTDHWWTSEVTMAHAGGDEPGLLLYGNGAPAGDPEATLVTPAREPHDPKSLRSRFKAIRSFIA